MFFVFCCCYVVCLIFSFLFFFNYSCSSEIHRLPLPAVLPCRPPYRYGPTDVLPCFLCVCSSVSIIEVSSVYRRVVCYGSCLSLWHSTWCTFVYWTSVLVYSFMSCYFDLSNYVFFYLFNDTALLNLSTLSLHDVILIYYFVILC